MSPTSNEVLSEQMRQMNEKLVDLKNDVAELQKEISTIYEMANRWKGGFIVVLSLGGFIGWVVSVSGGIRNLFGGH